MRNKPIVFPCLWTFQQSLILHLLRFLLPKSSFLYIESVEKRTFIYTDGAVFGADCRLYEIETRLARRGIIRISKSCLMNIAVLESVRRIANSRLEAVLKNGMRLIVSRTYLKDIRDYLASEGL